MKFLVPLIFAFAGVGAGVGAGIVLKPAPEEVAVSEGEGENVAEGGEAAPAKEPPKKSAEEEAVPTTEFVKLGNHFIVPILSESRVQSMVILGLDLEVAAGQGESTLQVEPKIRDALLSVMFDHANAGGFSGRFTSGASMDSLRNALREAARKAVGGDMLKDVLITDIVRQDV
ncbi:MAG: flagellar basal body-associated FliL family protein [Tropicimonas sp.]|uniref:flagellar basal body-associated FliL family protein n=1 Tax=Tropicimonas sp. TaxID=2067044 RepID=UPI003A85D231